jgi:hypothetical protein
MIEYRVVDVYYIFVFLTAKTLTGIFQNIHDSYDELESPGATLVNGEIET